MSNQDAVDKYIKAACDQFDTIVQHPKALEVVSEALFEEFFDEIVQGICFEAHRGFKRGSLNLYPIEHDAKTLETVVNNRQKSILVMCPVCKTQCDGTRFSGHLQNCMGYGRNNDRLRQGNRKMINYAESDGDDKEGEWDEDNKRKKKDARRTATTPKSRKPAVTTTVVKREGSSGYTSSFTDSETSNSTNDKLKMCGVLTKNSKKTCKNYNCSTHVQQRKPETTDSDYQIDIEGDATPTNGDSTELNSNASSPSTSSHSSSKKRRKTSKGKSQSKKRRSSSLASPKYTEYPNTTNVFDRSF